MVGEGEGEDGMVLLTADGDFFADGNVAGRVDRGLEGGGDEADVGTGF
jgi:hypothetical protein